MIILGDINSLLLDSAQITVSSTADENQSVEEKTVFWWKNRPWMKEQSVDEKTVRGWRNNPRMKKHSVDEILSVDDYA